MDHGAYILAHVAQELVCVVGMELPQESEAAGYKGRTIERVS